MLGSNPFNKSFMKTAINILHDLHAASKLKVWQMAGEVAQ